MPTTASDGLEASPDRRPMLEKPHQSPPEIPALCSSPHAHWVARCAYRELFFGEQSPSNGERADLETRYYELCNIRTFMRVDNVDQDNLSYLPVSVVLPVVTYRRHPSYDSEIHRLDTVLYVSTTRFSYAGTD